MTYTNKIIDGIRIPLTDAEISDLEARDVVWATRPAPVPQIVTAAQGRIALNAAGKRAKVEAAVAASSQDIQDYWQYSPYLNRQHPVILAMAAGLGWTGADLDALFIAAYAAA